MLITNQTVTQVHLVPEIDTQVARYDRVRWYRSTTGPNGYYEPATTEAPAPAMLQVQQLSRALTGTQLRLRINGSGEVGIAFLGPDPVDTAAVAALIMSASAEVVAAADVDVLTIQTVSTGSGATLEVLEGDAAPLIGFLVGELSIGTDADSALLPDTSEYRYEDHQSGPGVYYATEYRNSVTGRASQRSAPFQSRQLESIPLDQLIGCFVRLADLTGRPLGGRRIFIHNIFLPNRVVADGKRWGLFREYEELVTDPNGYASMLLIRGAAIDVTISGTGFTRRIKLPTVGTIVDLLDPLLEIRDEFGIQKPTLDFAIRTS